MYDPQMAEDSNEMKQNPPHPALSNLLHQWEEQRPDLDLTAFRLVGAVMQLSQVFEAEFKALAQQQFGIGAGDLRILMALRRAGEPYALRPTDLFQSLLVTSGAVTKQVERLAESGFVKRVLPKGARLRHLIALTPKGVRAANYAQEAIATSLAAVAPTLTTVSAAETKTTLATLEALLVAALARQPPPNVGVEDTEA